MSKGHRNPTVGVHTGQIWDNKSTEINDGKELETIGQYL